VVTLYWTVENDGAFSAVTSGGSGGTHSTREKQEDVSNPSGGGRGFLLFLVCLFKFIMIVFFIK
jgi:hypothetical protein